MSDVESAAPSVDELAAITEASPIQAMAHRSKRQAETMLNSFVHQNGWLQIGFGGGLWSSTKQFERTVFNRVS